ncbi:MAG: hypothetical protein ABI171_10465 [Collimonas sp.]|uniref:hypothetical protein n=1 Tax=Collimonas sp. TaxID=1963772 RepID=UPI003266CE06
MINSDVDLFTVGAVLGHMSSVSTRWHAHLVTDQLADAVGKKICAATAEKRTP